MLPFEGPPIADGAVLLDDAGRIVAVGPEHAVPAPPGIDAVRLAPTRLLLPGFVNTHTHLELTGFDGVAAEADFPAWIRQHHRPQGRPLTGRLSRRRPAGYPGWLGGRASPPWPTPVIPGR